MPKRSNEKQQIIEMLKAMTASAGWLVKPSGFLLDARLGEKFEVDIVAEKTDDGHVFIQSFEVVGKGRPATLGWAREMIAKHESLPTDRLFLVSWSGFVANAVKEAEHYPWVTLVEPLELKHGRVEGIGIIVEEIAVTLRAYAAFTTTADGEQRQLEIAPSSTVLRGDGTTIGHPERLAVELVHNPTFGAHASGVAHDHPQRETVSQFGATISLLTNGYRFLSDGVEAPLHAIWVRGDFAWKQGRVEMTVRQFGDHKFKHGKGTIGGKPHVIVASLDTDLDVLKIKVAPEVTKKSVVRKKGPQKQKAVTKTPTKRHLRRA